MSGKFKKEVARSQTLSQISNFSSQFDTVPLDYEHDKSLCSYQNSQSNLDIFQQKNSKYHDLNQYFSINKRVKSLRLSPHSSRSLTANLMNKPEFNINARSEYNLDRKDEIIESNEMLDIDFSVQSMSKKPFMRQNKTKESLFKQNLMKSKQQKIQQLRLSSASQLEYSINIQESSQNDNGGFVNNSPFQDKSFDNRFSQNMDFLKVPFSIKEGQQGFSYGSNSSQKQFKDKDCSIIYNSCQTDISCSISMKLINQSKRNQNTTSNISQYRASLAEEDEDNLILFSNPSNSRQNDQPNIERQKEIMKEYTQSTISKLNHLNEKMIELEQSQYQDNSLWQYCRSYISQNLRLIKCAPFASIPITTSLVNSSASSHLNLLYSDSFQLQNMNSHQDYKTFHSNQSSIVKLHPHYITKFSLDIDSLDQKDICFTTDEFYTFVLPLDPHFPNVILLGTLSGKILLFSLSKEKPRKKYILKYSQQIFNIQNNQIYPTCAVQIKSNFYIGGSDGSVHLYDFKKKQIVCSLKNDNYINFESDTSSRNQEKSIFGSSMLGCSSIKNEEDHKIMNSVKNIKATANKVLFSRQDGTIFQVKSEDLNQVLFQKKYDGLLKCDFSCDNDNNIIILTDEKLEIIHTPLQKIVFKMKPNIYEHHVYSDFQVNKLTKEVIVLSNNQLMQSSKIQILTNKTTNLRVIETLSTHYVLHSLILDKQMQNMFCIGQNEIKIWQYYNQSEFQKIKQSLFDKLVDQDDILTTNDSY